MEDVPPTAEESEDDEADAESDEDAEEQSPVEVGLNVSFYWQINPKHFQTLYNAVAEVQELKGTPPVPAETGVLSRPPPKYFVIPVPTESKVT